MLFGNYVSAELGDSKKRLKLKANEIEVTNGMHWRFSIVAVLIVSVKERIFGAAAIEAVDSGEAIATDGD